MLLFYQPNFSVPSFARDAGIKPALKDAGLYFRNIFFKFIKINIFSAFNQLNRYTMLSGNH